MARPSLFWDALARMPPIRGPLIAAVLELRVGTVQVIGRPAAVDQARRQIERCAGRDPIPLERNLLLRAAFEAEAAHGKSFGAACKIAARRLGPPVTASQVRRALQLFDAEMLDWFGLDADARGRELIVQTQALLSRIEDDRSALPFSHAEPQYRQRLRA